MKQPEVDINKITVLGNSEGTAILPRVTIDNLGKVGIVLMGVLVQNISTLLSNRSLLLLYAQKVLGKNHDGLLSLQEASKNVTSRV
jgi:hypothetical protein